jgi:hypothetical protein
VVALKIALVPTMIMKLINETAKGNIRENFFISLKQQNSNNIPQTDPF